MADVLNRHYKRGDRLLASDVNKLSKAAWTKSTPGTGVLPGATSEPGIEYMWNSSGEDVVAQVPCSITGIKTDTECLQFIKPDSAPYGIVLEDTKSDHRGLVAVSGGPYKVNLKVTDIEEYVAVGDLLTPVSGQWYFEEDSSGSFQSLSVESDHTCIVRMLPGGGTTSYRTDTVNLPVTRIPDGDWVDLANFTLPAGKQIYIIAAVIADEQGNQNAGYDLECYNVTDAVSVYEMSSATILEGTVAAPLASGAMGDKVVIRAENNSGVNDWLCAFMTFVVA